MNRTIDTIAYATSIVSTCTAWNAATTAVHIIHSCSVRTVDKGRPCRRCSRCDFIPNEWSKATCSACRDPGTSPRPREFAPPPRPPRLIADVRMPRLLATAQIRRAREQRSTRERQ